ncbi:MAG: hypothetical protein ACI351_07680 [Candidatus Avelusimicrobium sp.]|uniref:hypothetical protein n=1 Tax=Candidatus Avelusimicrobium sp. TaxID=3048833 RepID=UPI003F0E2B8E
MTALILLLLIAATVIYAVFFLIFKIIWMIIKKQGNKWPLIWAGVCTFLFCAGSAALIGWGTYKVIKPFTGIIERTQTQPQPVYGQTEYTDPEYGFTLTVFNGMDFSDWMHFSGTDVKLGVDTNVFKKDNAGKDFKGPITIAAILRTANKPEDTSVSALKKALETNKDRRIEIDEMYTMTIDGNPALYVSGTAYGNRGESVPVWLVAAENGKYVYYVGIMEISEDGNNSQVPEKTVQSLRFSQN